METLFEDNLTGNQVLASFPEQLDEKNQSININNNLILTNIDENDTASLMSSMNELPNESEFNFEKLFDITPVANNGNNNNTSGGFTQEETIGNTNFDNQLSLTNSNNTLVSNTYGQQLNSQDGEGVGNNQNVPNLSDYYNNNKELNDFAWDFNFDTTSFNNLHGDSTTLGSSTRESHEFFESLNSMGLDDIDDINDQTKRSRFTSSISNSISSIFKNSSNTRFNLRVINPLSTHRDPKVLVKSLPNLVENVENLSIDHNEDELMTDDIQSKKKKCVKNSHLKNCNCTNKQPKKTKKNSSLVSTLTNGRIGGDKSEPQVVEEQEQDIESDVDMMSPQQENTPQPQDHTLEFKFDDELTKVISLASLNSSVNYNFNDANSHLSTDHEDLESDDKSNHSPDYAALFSDMNVPTKKRSKSISFKKMTSLNSSNNNNNNNNNQSTPSLPSLPEDSDLIIPTPSSSSDIPADYQPPIREPTRRGRKPSLAYDATKQFVCTYCSRRFRRQEHLKRHFRSLHTNEKPFDCELCGKKFSRSDNLAQHIKTHANEKE